MFTKSAYMPDHLKNAAGRNSPISGNQKENLRKYNLSCRQHPI